MKKRIKRTFSIHHWIGLVAGVFLLIASVTGSLLVFHNEIDQAQFANKSILEQAASELNIDGSLEQIRAMHPEADIRIPHFPKDLNQALKYEIRNEQGRKWIIVHPESGNTMATVEQADQRLVHILLNLHYNLYAGTPGKIIVLLGGLALITLSITGFILYRKSILKVLSFRQQISFTSRRSFFSSLHRIIGVWSLVFNLFISITGSWIAYTIVESALSSGSTPVKEAPAYLPISSVDKALKQIERDYPAFEINYLRFPPDAEGSFSVLGKLSSDPAFYGRTASSIAVDMRTGKVVKTNFLRDAPWNKRLIKVLTPLHFGDYGGLSVKIIYSFFGIFPAILAISGFLVWRNRSIAAPRNRRKRFSKPLAHSSSF